MTAGTGHSARGAALITALVVAALATAAAIAMASRTQLEIGRVTYQIESVRREELVQMIEAEVRSVLHADAQGARFDAADDAWSQMHTGELGASVATAVVRDVQRLFNLNNLGVTPGNAPGSGRRSNAAADRAANTFPRTSAERLSDRLAAGDRSPSQGARASGPTSRNRVDASSAADSGQSNGQDDPPVFEQRARFAPDPSGETAGAVALQDSGSAPSRSASVLSTQATAMSSEESGGSAGTNRGAVSPSSAVTSPTVTLPANELWIARFSLLLRNLDIREPVLQPILDWLDADSEVRFPNGAEDAYYLKQDSPYRAANRPFADISELLLVRSVTPAVYERLAPFVMALPVHTDVNVNTAPPEVLMGLAPEFDRRIADMIIAARNVQPFQSTAALLSLPMLTAAGIDGFGMGVGSAYFEVTTTVTTGAAVEQSRAIIGRLRNGRSRIISRHNGYFDE